jgi:hypothetical protein
MKEMTIECPVCKQALPDKFQLYKDDKIHALHSMIDELNAGLVPVGDPTFAALSANSRERKEKSN